MRRIGEEHVWRGGGEDGRGRNQGVWGVGEGVWAEALT